MWLALVVGMATAFPEYTCVVVLAIVAAGYLVFTYPEEIQTTAIIVGSIIYVRLIVWPCMRWLARKLLYAMAVLARGVNREVQRMSWPAFFLRAAIASATVMVIGAFSPSHGVISDPILLMIVLESLMVHKAILDQRSVRPKMHVKQTAHKDTSYVISTWLPAGCNTRQAFLYIRDHRLTA